MFPRPEASATEKSGKMPVGRVVTRVRVHACACACVCVCARVQCTSRMCSVHTPYTLLGRLEPVHNRGKPSENARHKYRFGKTTRDVWSIAQRRRQLRRRTLFVDRIRHYNTELRMTRGRLAAPLPTRRDTRVRAERRAVRDRRRQVDVAAVVPFLREREREKNGKKKRKKTPPRKTIVRQRRHDEPRKWLSCVIRFYARRCRVPVPAEFETRARFFNIVTNSAAERRGWTDKILVQRRGRNVSERNSLRAKVRFREKSAKNVHVY